MSFICHVVHILNNGIDLELICSSNNGCNGMISYRNDQYVHTSVAKQRKAECLNLCTKLLRMLRQTLEG